MWASLVTQRAPAMQENWVCSLSWEDSLEKGMATHSSSLAWRIPWTEEPGELQSMGLHIYRTHVWLRGMNKSRDLKPKDMQITVDILCADGAQFMMGIIGECVLCILFVGEGVTI